MGEGGTIALAECVRLQRGTTYKSRLLGQPGPVLLGLASIARNGGFRRDSLRTYGGDSPEKLILQPGDLYVSLKDVTQSADLLGSVAQVPPDVESGRLTQDTVKLAFIRDDVSRNYLYWILRTPLYRDYCRSRAIGTTNLSLSREDFLAFEFPWPTVARYELVRLLGALDDKIAVNERISRASNELAQTAYLQALCTSPHTKLQLRDLATIVMGQSPPGESCNRAGDGQPLLNGPTEFGSQFPIPTQWTTKLTRSCSEGDILLCVRGSTTGRLNWADRDYVIGRGLAAIRARTTTAETFLLHTSLVHKMDDLLAFASGSVFPNLSRASLEKLPIPWLDWSVRGELAGYMATLGHACLARDRENLTLAQLRDTLLPKLMSGALRVRDAEKVVEDAT